MFPVYPLIFLFEPILIYNTNIILFIYKYLINVFSYFPFFLIPFTSLAFLCLSLSLSLSLSRSLSLSLSNFLSVDSSKYLSSLPFFSLYSQLMYLFIQSDFISLLFFRNFFFFLRSFLFDFIFYWRQRLIDTIEIQIELNARKKRQLLFTTRVVKVSRTGFIFMSFFFTFLFLPPGLLASKIFFLFKVLSTKKTVINRCLPIFQY